MVDQFFCKESFLETHAHPFICTLSVAAFTLSWQHWLWQRPPGSQSKKYLLHGPYRKSLLTPDLDHWFSAMTAHREHWERCLSSHGQVLAPEILASWIWSATCAGHFNVQPSFRTAVLDQKLSTLIWGSESLWVPEIHPEPTKSEFWNVGMRHAWVYFK